MLAATMLAALAIGSAAAEAAATNGNGREGGNPGPPGATAGPGVPAGSGAATEDRRTPFERNCSEHDRTTALLHAANRGDAEMVSVLLAHGADRTLVDRYGRTALDFARMSVHPEVLRVLAGGEAKAVRRSAGEDLADKGTPPQAARSLKEAWRFDAPAVIARGPFLVDDALVFADAQGTIFALRASTGGRIWSYRGDGHITAVRLARDGLLFVVTACIQRGRGAIAGHDVGAGEDSQGCLDSHHRFSWRTRAFRPGRVA